MTEAEIAPYRHLWASVLTMALREYRALLVAASRRSRFASRDGKDLMVASFAAELAHARGYFDSADARKVAALAGTEIRIDRIMSYLTDGLTDPEQPMTDHSPTRRTQRQRERHGRKDSQRAARDAYNRDGLDAACRALGAGDAEDWPQEPLEGGQDGRNGVSGYADTPEGKRASGGQQRGQGDE